MNPFQSLPSQFFFTEAASKIVKIAKIQKNVKNCEYQLFHPDAIQMMGVPHLQLHPWLALYSPSGGNNAPDSMFLVSAMRQPAEEVYRQPVHPSLHVGQQQQAPTAPKANHQTRTWAVTNEGKALSLGNLLLSQMQKTGKFFPLALKKPQTPCTGLNL